MKKILIITGLVLLAYTNSFAGALPFAFGLRATGNGSWFKFQDTQFNVDKRSLAMGGGFGPYVRLGFGKIYAEAELSINSRNYDTDVFWGPFNITYNFKYKSTTLDLPITVGWKFIKVGSADLRVLAGLGVANILSEKSTVNGNDYNDFKDHTYSTYSFWIVGIGADIWKLNADLRYYGGYTDLYNGDAKGNIYPNSINLSVGLRLFGGK